MANAQAGVCCVRKRAVGLWLRARVVAVPGLAGRADVAARRDAVVAKDSVALRLLEVRLFVDMRRALSVRRVWQHHTHAWSSSGNGEVSRQ